MPIPILSFFTGGGLLDIGFEKAGFEIVWTNELNEKFAGMYEEGVTNWRNSQGIYTPAKISTRKSITDICAKEVLREAFSTSGRPEMFGMIGGPPCPDFSVAGKHMGSEGKHGTLTKTFIDMVIAAQPPFFVMENVPGLYKIKKHRKFLDDLIETIENEYWVDMRLLNALEYGIPQDRERLIVFGVKRKWGEKYCGCSIAQGERGWFNWPVETFKGAKKYFQWPETNEFGTTPDKPAGIPERLMLNWLLSGNALKHPECVANGRDVFVAHSSRFKTVAEGDVSGKSFKRLHRYRYSPTVWYGNNEVHLHPWAARRLSVREAMRIQTVPDEYEISGKYSLFSKFKMVANGVPCDLAEQLAKSIRIFFESNHVRSEATSEKQLVLGLEAGNRGDGRYTGKHTRNTNRVKQ